MTDQQLVSLAITVLALLGAVLVNNSRLTDVKEVLRAEIKAQSAETNARFAESEARFVQLSSTIEMRFMTMDRKLDEILRIVGDHETRISTIEHK